MALGTFLLSCLLWLFVVSNNSYNMVVEVPIEARNLSEQHALKKEVPKFAKVRLKGSGRSLFKSYVLKSFFPNFKLVIDLERISEEYNFILNDYFERYPQKVSIPSNFNVEFLEVIYPKTIHISLDEYKEKIVKVVVDAKISTAPGYVLVGNSKIKPTEVRIAGPRDIIEKIDYISTFRENLTNIQNQISMDMSLSINTEDKLIEVSPNKIFFNQNVELISERIISEIPVFIQNIENNIQAFVSPQTVSLTVVGGIDYISNLRPEKISISVDFSKWKSSQQFYSLNVKVPNDIIKWMDLSPQNIELIVTKSIE